MTYPAGVTTIEVSSSGYLDAFGNECKIVVRVRPYFGETMERIIWSATGEPVNGMYRTFSAKGVPVTFTVPVTDQDGWTDGSGSDFSGWAYEARTSVLGPDGKERASWRQMFQPVTADGPTFDLDEVPDSTYGAVTLPPVLTPVPGPTGPAGGTDAATAEWALGGPLTSEALRLPAHQLAADSNEPRGVISWTFDDGYTYAVDYFALMNSKAYDVTGTLFLTKNWVDLAGTNATWNDTYITSAQVQAISGAGHELGTHGLNHEGVTTYRNANGDAALAALYDTLVDYIEAVYTDPNGDPVKVLSGAYPAGASDRRCREIMGRRHQFFRGTRGTVAVGAWNPYDVPAIDVQTYTEAQLKAFVDTAVAEDALLVFLTHGVTAGTALTRADQLAKVSAVMDYANGLGVRQTSFGAAMTERTMRRSPGLLDDTSGNAFRRRLRTQRLSLVRSDTVNSNLWAEFDTVNNAVYFDGDTGQPVDFRANGLRVSGSRLEVGRQSLFSGTTTVGSPDVVLTGLVADNLIIGAALSGTNIPAGAFVGSWSGATVSMVDNVGAPLPATVASTATVTMTVAAGPLSRFFNRVEFHGTNPRVVGVAPSGDGYDIYDATGTRTFRVTAVSLARVTSGTYTVDTAGGNLQLKSARTKLQDTTGAAFISFNPSQPTDASVANSEFVHYPVFTTGAAKYFIRGKEAGGTVRAINFPMTPVALAAVATDAATTQTLVNDIRAKLVATGMYS